jgi:hypothetical protein
MLSICRQACTEHGFSPKLEQARFESFTADRHFSAIVLPAGSFHLITDFAAAMTVLERFRAHLAPGGRLLVDLSVASTLYQLKPRVRHWTRSADELLTLHEHPAGLDAVAQTVTHHLRYDHWKNTRLAASEIDVFSMRWWGVEEFRMALMQAGFQTVRIYADYNRTAPLTGGTQTLTFEAI